MLGRAVDVDLGDLDRWCHANLQTGVARIIFQEGYLSTVLGAETTSGGQVVVKIRRPAERLEACGLAHRRLFDAGFACPEPLVGLEPFGPFVASAETLISGGARWPDSGRAPDPFAQALAALMAAAPAPTEVPTLEPPLPWTGPDRQQQGLWPSPDDRDVDLNAIDGPDWLDEAGRVARSRFEETGDHLVVGHGDWYTGNLRWSGLGLHVAWDWDSVIAASEAWIVGLAAALYPATEAGTEATIAETEGFLNAYQAARGRTFSADEIRQAGLRGYGTAASMPRNRWLPTAHPAPSTKKKPANAGVDQIPPKPCFSSGPVLRSSPLSRTRPTSKPSPSKRPLPNASTSSNTVSINAGKRGHPGSCPGAWSPPGQAEHRLFPLLALVSRDQARGRRNLLVHYFGMRQDSISTLSAFLGSPVECSLASASWASARFTSLWKRRWM